MWLTDSLRKALPATIPARSTESIGWHVHRMHHRSDENANKAFADACSVKVVHSPWHLQGFSRSCCVGIVAGAR